MILSYANIIHYTINQLSWKIDNNHIQRIVDRRSVDEFFVMGNYSISENAGSDFPTRNRSFSIENYDDYEFCFFIKQSKAFVKDNLVSILRESLFYQVIKSTNTGLNDYLPKFYDFNITDAILTLSFLKGTSNFADFRKKSPINETQNLKIVATAGTLLRKFHDTLRPFKNDFKKKAPIFFNVNPITIFDIDFDYLDFQEQYYNNLEPIIKTLNKYEKEYSLKSIVIEAQKIWKNSDSTIIHGDFKAANILVHESNLESIYFIDWEYVIEGCPEYDLASFLYYELVVSKFEINTDILLQFTNLLLNYYQDDMKEDYAHRIIILFKARLIDYWVGSKLSKAINPDDESNKVQKLMQIFKLLKLENDVFVDNRIPENIT